MDVRGCFRPSVQAASDCRDDMACCRRSAALLAPPGLYRRRVRFLSLVCSLVLLPAAVYSVEQAQVLDLRAGWNAVWLEVSPMYDSGERAGEAQAVEDVFEAAAIELVATPRFPAGTAEFVTSPDEYLFNQPGWSVWRRNSELGEDSLVVLRGNRAYLVYVAGESDLTTTVTGTVTYYPPDWSPDQYNLVGFGLLNSVTFDAFFADSAGHHPVSKIYRIEAAGTWVRVTGNDVMSSNEAYWVFSEGASNFAGPLRLLVPTTSGEICFGPGPGTVEIADPQGAPGDTISLSTRELTFTNASASPANATLRKIMPATVGAAALADDLRLYDVTPNPAGASYVLGGEGQVVEMEIGEIAPETTSTITLGVHRAWRSGARGRENLYRLELAHNYYWLPVSAENPDLSDADVADPDPQYQGLWIGQVTFDQVGSITEAGAPLRSTTSALPMRVLLHVDGNGVVFLLSHVMVMRKKTADDSVKGEQVLVVDEAKIPYFEGIEERGGKRVGRRIEAVGYAMPRKLDPGTQSALLDEVVAAFSNLDDPGEVTSTHIAYYIRSRSSRPPDLAEEYHHSWQMLGGLGPDALLETVSPLVLDPFHRSNPFRHAFHTRHGAGYAIERDIAIAFDGRQEAGVLAGVYSESIRGLASDRIKVQGRVEFRRVSEIGGLE